MALWPSLARLWRMTTMQCGPVRRPWPCQRRSEPMPRTSASPRRRSHSSALKRRRVCQRMAAVAERPAAAVCSLETVSRCLAPSMGASQRGRPRPCCLSPSPRHDWCVSRPAACERPAGGTVSRSARSGEGVRWRGGIRARSRRGHQREGSWGARGGRTWSVEKAV
jgi:hypothetical protein